MSKKDAVKEDTNKDAAATHGQVNGTTKRKTSGVKEAKSTPAKQNETASATAEIGRRRSGRQSRS